MFDNFLIEKIVARLWASCITLVGELYHTCGWIIKFRVNLHPAVSLMCIITMIQVYYMYIICIIIDLCIFKYFMYLYYLCMYIIIMYICICIYVCMYVHTAYIHTCIHITYIHIHPYIHTHILTCIFLDYVCNACDTNI